MFSASAVALEEEEATARAAEAEADRKFTAEQRKQADEAGKQLGSMEARCVFEASMPASRVLPLLNNK